MTAVITSPQARSEGPSSMVVERPNRASIETRIVHPLLACTLGLALTTVTRFGGASQLQRLGRLLDLPAVVLVAPHGTRRARVRLDNCGAEWLWHDEVADPRQRPESVLLYFHGGGYVGCGLNTHRRMVATLARASGMAALNVDYRQLPFAHVTDTLDDAVDSYRYLLELGYRPERIIVSGDSAGGGLAFQLALATRERGLPMPGGISAIAPWADFDPTMRNAHPNRHRDPYVPVEAMDLIARHGIAVDGRLDPTWSPVNHDFAGLPPVMIQVGSTECLLPDAELLAQRCAHAQVPTRLQIWDHAPHVHHIAADLLPDARAAIHDLAAFHRALVADKPEPPRERRRRRAAVPPHPRMNSTEAGVSSI